jgi:hypothetical protein
MKFSGVRIQLHIGDMHDGLVILYHGIMNSGLKSDPFDGYLRLR